jgi:hypothetical protein
MGYESVDKLQNLLATNIFHYASDKKKASGRALGTFVELITFYILKNWEMETFTAMERPLPEFANSDITHNVEFTLHGSRHIVSGKFTGDDIPISCKNLIKKYFGGKNELSSKGGMLIDKNLVIKNACVLSSGKEIFIAAYINSQNNTYKIHALKNKPFAMLECKRVGVEEGMRKGPQTIEKAKQGSYVARTVSSLQRIRYLDGNLGGIIQKQDGSFIIEDYYTILNKLITSGDSQTLNNFILTIGVISNHGNWFTAETQNKELKVLGQSYDWLIFLTDDGIGEFITDLLINPQKENMPVKEAFNKSYNEIKTGNIFTKVKIDYYADRALTNYFRKNRLRIESWFNVITPGGRKMKDLKKELKTLAEKNWWSNTL